MRILEGRSDQSRAFRFLEKVEQRIRVRPHRRAQQVEGERASDHGGRAKCFQSVIAKAGQAPADHEAEALRHADVAQLKVAAKLSAGIEQLALFEQMFEQLLDKKWIPFGA